MEWTTFRSSLRLDSEQALQAETLLTAAKEGFAAVCGRGTADGKSSPLAFLARRWNDAPELEAAALEGAFLAYLGGERAAGAGASYLEEGGRIAARAGERLAAGLDAAQRGALAGLGLDSLLQVETASDPLGARLKELLAGLPPPVEAVAASGLPAAEEHGAKFAGLFCAQPFQYAQIDPLGQLYLCCPQLLPTSVGRLDEQDLMSAWNSPAAVAVRESILDGTFAYCCESTCGLLQQRALPRVEEVTHPEHRRIIAERITRLDHGPRIMNLSYDRSCNLACPSCRGDFIVLRGKARQRASVIHERVLGRHLRDAERLIITGSGDPFGSRLYLSFLRTFDPAAIPGLRITLSTNGLLLNEETWRSICHNAVDSVDVSVDAATPATYAANRGGDFAQLLANLRFLGGLRAAGELARFELHFVVQANNFREMRAFAELGRELGCDVVCFKQLVNWGTYSAADYARRAVQAPDHPEHGELRELLRDPLLRDPRVYLHDLSHLLESV